jgi:hypothetical protein
VSEYPPSLARMFPDLIRDMKRRLRDVELRTSPVNPTSMLYATTGIVDPAYSSGLPRVTLAGDSVLSAAGYPYLATYTPAASDVVLLLPLRGSYVIGGRVIGLS